MSDLPKMHSREVIVRTAQRDLDSAFLDIWKKHDLTEGEMIKIVSNFSNSHIAGAAKYMIREERHGNSETPGGFE